MDAYKLKIKIGDAEFDAEGPVEVVQAQFEAFKQLIERVPVKTAEVVPDRQIPVSGTPAFEKIMKVEGRIVSLTTHVGSIADAVLLVLTGQKVLRNNDSITGAEVIDGLRQSGHTVPRVDNYLDKLAAEGRVLKVGEGRARRYRLTNQGLAKGMELAREAAATVS